MSFGLLQFSNNKHAIIDLEALIALHSKTTETKIIKGEHKNNKFNYEQSFRFCFVVFLGVHVQGLLWSQGYEAELEYRYELCENVQLNLRYQSKMYSISKDIQKIPLNSEIWVKKEM